MAIGEGDGFVNVSASILQSDLVEALPAERVTLLAEKVESHEQLRRCLGLGFDDPARGFPRVRLRD